MWTHRRGAGNSTIAQEKRSRVAISRPSWRKPPTWQCSKWRRRPSGPSLWWPILVVAIFIALKMAQRFEKWSVWFLLFMEKLLNFWSRFSCRTIIRKTFACLMLCQEIERICHGEPSFSVFFFFLKKINRFSRPLVEVPSAWLRHKR